MNSARSPGRQGSGSTRFASTSGAEFFRHEQAAVGLPRVRQVAVERVRVARALQDIGLTLDEVVDALHTYYAEKSPTCADQRWRLERALDRIDQTIAELGQTRAEVVAVLDDEPRRSLQVRGTSRRSLRRTASVGPTRARA